MHSKKTSKLLLALLSSTITLALPQTAPPPSPPTPKPALTNVSFWGSACPENNINGLTTSIGPLNTTTNTYPLTFTLLNFLPTLDGSFGSSLRMCDIVSTLVVPRHDGEETKWKVSVNKYGTSAVGDADLAANVTMYLRGSYSFAESAEKQSIGMLDVQGPLAGPFAKQLIREEADEGIVGTCGAPSELDIEFQARAVRDFDRSKVIAANGTAWVLKTDLEVIRC